MDKRCCGCKEKIVYEFVRIILLVLNFLGFIRDDIWGLGEGREVKN